MLKALGPFLWPKSWKLRTKVVVSLSLLIANRYFNLLAPLYFQKLVDELVTHSNFVSKFPSLSRVASSSSNYSVNSIKTIVTTSPPISSSFVHNLTNFLSSFVKRGATSAGKLFFSNSNGNTSPSQLAFMSLAGYMMSKIVVTLSQQVRNTVFAEVWICFSFCFCGNFVYFSVTLSLSICFSLSLCFFPLILPSTLKVSQAAVTSLSRDTFRSLLSQELGFHYSHPSVSNILIIDYRMIGIGEFSIKFLDLCDEATPTVLIRFSI